MRIGFGYDSHRLSENRDFILGGVKIPHTMGLYGHSDADVLTHAIIDAILGALAKGDIGRWFPDTDERYKGISSIKLLERVMEETKCSIINIDCTVIAQKPKLAPHIESIRESLSAVLGIAVDKISIKAKTEEGMDAVGRGELVKAYCVTLAE